MNNKMIGSKPLYVSLAQRRDVRRQQLESQIAQRNHMRMHQVVANGMNPGGPYLNGPMYYPGPGAYGGPPGAPRGVMGYPPQPNLVPRPRYGPPGQGQLPGGLPLPAQYSQVPQGYGIPPGYPRDPRAPPQPQQAQIPRPGGPAGLPAGAVPPPAGAPRTGAPGPTPTGPVPVPGVRPGIAPTVNGGVPPPRPGGVLAGGPPGGIPRGSAPAGAPARRPLVGVPTEGGEAVLTSAALANASPMDQKQMLGEVIYLRIFAVQPELAGKITGMLLEMDNSELLHLLEDSDAMEAKVSEAISVLNDFTNKEGEAA